MPVLHGFLDEADLLGCRPAPPTLHRGDHFNTRQMGERIGIHSHSHDHRRLPMSYRLCGVRSRSLSTSHSQSSRSRQGAMNAAAPRSAAIYKLTGPCGFAGGLRGTTNPAA